MYVVRAYKLDKRFLMEIQDLYDDNKFKNLNLILNGVKHTGGKYDSYYGYYSSKPVRNQNKVSLKPITDTPFA